MHDTDSLTIEQLANAVGLPVRTIRYYITEGLLPGPGTRGKAATYTVDHRRRLELIRELAEQRLPLREIRERVTRLSPEAVGELLAAESGHLAELQVAATSASPKEYIALLLERARSGARELSSEKAAPMRQPHMQTPPERPVASRLSTANLGSEFDRTVQTWERWERAPGVELHVRTDAIGDNATLVHRLLEIAGRP
jgi:DNA-binding transcriptional MerR regulator